MSIILKENYWLCPVCRKSLRANGNSCLCENRHCFDIAKSGYVNLILSNKSLHGDDKEMITARRTFLNSGHYKILCDALCDSVKSVSEMRTVILDAGCGECYYTSEISKSCPEAAVLGIDLSKDALKAGGKRNAGLLLAAASVYDIPLADESVDIVVSVFAPMATREFRRILKNNGILIRVIPLAKHLFGMKKILYENPYENEEEREIPEGFEVLSEHQIRSEIHLLHDEIISLFKMTPYFYRTDKKGRERLYSFDSLDTEIEFGILIFRKI